MTLADPTRIEIDFDPIVQRMTGVAYHGNTPFSVPYISHIGYNLWQGGTRAGLVLPTFIKHLVSLYPWEKYTINHKMASVRYVEMYDSEAQGLEQVDEIARHVNECREFGPTLVVCQAGLNRSSLIAARAIYLEWRGKEVDGADPIDGPWIVEHLRGARSPAVLCNPAFEAEVLSWQ